MTSSSNFFDVAVFLLPNLVTSSSFMSISTLVLELWQLSFTRDWPEILKSEIRPSEFCSIPGTWGELGTPNLARTSLMKSYCMKQNVRVTAFTVSKLLKENKQGKITPPTRNFLSSCVCKGWYQQKEVLETHLQKLMKH